MQYAGRLIAYPWSIDYVEWPEIARAWDLVRGVPIYGEWETFPFREANYTPLFTMINAVFVNFTGPTPTSGRIIALLCTFGIMAIVSAIVYKNTQRKLSIALMAGALYASSFMVWVWSSIVRVDNLAVFLSVSSLMCFGLRSRHQKYLIFSIILCVASAFTRQTMIAAAAAILLTLLFENRSAFFKMLGLYCGLGGLGLILLLGVTGGNAWTHLVVANINELDWAILPFYVSDLWTVYYWLTPSVLLGVWVLRKSRVLLFYALFSTLVSLTIVKIGSSFNYLLEWWFSMSMLAASGLSAPFVLEGWKRHASAAVLVLTFLIGWQQVAHIPWEKQTVEGMGLRSMPLDGWNSFIEWETSVPFYLLNPWGRTAMESIVSNIDIYPSTPALWEAENMAYIEGALRTIDGPILSEDMNFTVSIEKEIMIQPFEFEQMASQGVWSPLPLDNCLIERCFGAIVLMFDLDSEDVPYASHLRFSTHRRRLMRDGYELTFKRGGYWIYQPRSM